MNELAKNSVFGNLMPSYIETLDNILFNDNIFIGILFFEFLPTVQLRTNTFNNTGHKFVIRAEHFRREALLLCITYSVS